MPMKVKVFYLKDSNEKAIQDPINGWLGENLNIHIEHITQSQVQHGQHMEMPLTICIWYTEKN